MKHHSKSLRKTAMLLGVNLIATTLTGQNLLVNGSFETPTISGNSISGWEFREGQQLTGWTISTQSGRGIAHYDIRYHIVSSGRQAIEFEDIGQAVSQTFSTVVGDDYELTFDLGANVTNGQVRVSVGPRTAVFDSGGTNFLPQVLRFTASSEVTTLKFEKITTQSAYPLLDNVSVRIAPPLEDLVLQIRTSELQIAWPSISNRAYEVQYRSTVTSNTWIALVITNIMGTGEQISVFDRILTGEPQKFYRVREFR